MSVQNQVCAIPVGQPTLSDVCGALGLGGQPTRQERLAFEALPPGDCEALSDYRTRFEDSPLRVIADSRLADRRVTQEDRWGQGAPQVLDLFVGADASRAPTEAAAQAGALDRGAQEAERLCRNFEASTLYRFNGATPVAQAWSCEVRDGGHVCGFRGVAQCDLDVRERVERATCGAQ